MIDNDAAARGSSRRKKDHSKTAAARVPSQHKSQDDPSAAARGTSQRRWHSGASGGRTQP